MSTETISRREALSLLGLAAVAVPAMLTASSVEGQEMLAQASPPPPGAAPATPRVQPGRQTWRARRASQRAERLAARRARREAR